MKKRRKKKTCPYFPFSNILIQNIFPFSTSSSTTTFFLLSISSTSIILLFFSSPILSYPPLPYPSHSVSFPSFILLFLPTSSSSSKTLLSLSFPNPRPLSSLFPLVILPFPFFFLLSASHPALPLLPCLPIVHILLLSSSTCRSSSSQYPPPLSSSVSHPR